MPLELQVCVRRHQMSSTPVHPPTALASAAQALEEQAAAALQAAELGTAAHCLAQASTLWARQGEWLRQGSSGLLSASTWRLAGNLAQAESQLAVLAASPLPPALARAVVLEACEQHLAAGRPREALRGFQDFWARFHDQLELEQRPHILQRRAAAAIAAHAWGVAVEDLTLAAAWLQGADAEACLLAAVNAQLQLDAGVAYRLWQRLIDAGMPADGAAAVQRGLVGAAIADKLGDTPLVLQCLDSARQGALEAGGDTASAYLAAKALYEARRKV
jgi:hypothetical protein